MRQLRRMRWAASPELRFGPPWRLSPKECGSGTGCGGLLVLGLCLCLCLCLCFCLCLSTPYGRGCRPIEKTLRAKQKMKPPTFPLVVFRHVQFARVRFSLFSPNCGVLLYWFREPFLAVAETTTLSPSNPRSKVRVEEARDLPLSYGSGLGCRGG